MPLERPVLACWPGYGVCGRLSKVYVLERLVGWPGAFARGAPVLLYGMSLWREYGKRGSTAVMRLADAVLHAEMQINWGQIRGTPHR
jgi:hypothetical protein